MMFVNGNSSEILLNCNKVLALGLWMESPQSTSIPSTELGEGGGAVIFSDLKQW